MKKRVLYANNNSIYVPTDTLRWTMDSVGWIILALDTDNDGNDIGLTIASNAADDDGQMLLRIQENGNTTLNGSLCVYGGVCSAAIGASGGYNIVVEDGAICAGNAPTDDCSNAAMADGIIYAVGALVDHTDLAENFPTNEKLEPGDVVYVEPQIGKICTDRIGNKCIKDELGLIPFVTKTSKPYDSRVVGMVSTEPGLVLGGFSNKKYIYYNETPVVMAGRSPVKTTNKNGNIEPGDLLTTSSRQGYAMKCSIETTEQKMRCMGSILGKALEPCYNETCKITALITLQ